MYSRKITICKIVPNFDYCLSLSIYFSKCLIQKLVNLYSTCILRLFKIRFVDQEATTVNGCLKSYSLFSFQYRILFRLFWFSFKIVACKPSPIRLLDQLKLETHAHNIRDKPTYATNRTLTNIGERKFGFFFSKFLMWIFPALQ